MSQPDPRIEAFFAKTPWRNELLALRAVLLAAGLCEDFKWRSPVYTHDGANIAILWGFKDRAALGFFKGVLLSDPARILDAPGENSRSARVLNITDPARIQTLRPTLDAYLMEAIEIEKAGLKPDLPKDDLDYPDEFVDRLDADADFRAAFETLTPGRRRGWVLNFSQPKQAKTRIARIDKAAPRILAGKGMHDR